MNRIYEKTFRSDLSAQKTLSFDELRTTSQLLFAVKLCLESRRIFAESNNVK